MGDEHGTILSNSTTVFTMATEYPPLKKGEPHGRAMIVMHLGEGFVLAWDGDEGVYQWLEEIGGAESFSMSRAGIDAGDLPDGLYIGEFKWVDEGPSDWPGAGNEASLAFVKARLATLEEWKHHLDGEWPWEPMHDDDAAPAT